MKKKQTESFSVSIGKEIVEEDIKESGGTIKEKKEKELILDSSVLLRDTKECKYSNSGESVSDDLGKQFEDFGREESVDRVFNEKPKEIKKILPAYIFHFCDLSLLKDEKFIEFLKIREYRDLYRLLKDFPELEKEVFKNKPLQSAIKEYGKEIGEGKFFDILKAFENTEKSEDIIKQEKDLSNRVESCSEKKLIKEESEDEIDLFLKKTLPGNLCPQKLLSDDSSDNFFVEYLKSRKDEVFLSVLEKFQNLNRTILKDEELELSKNIYDDNQLQLIKQQFKSERLDLIKSVLRGHKDLLTIMVQYAIDMEEEQRGCDKMVAEAFNS